MAKTSAQRSLDGLEAEFRSVKRQFRATAAFALAMLGGGAVFFHFVEHLKWLDAFYFCTITLTTIGYGDIVPKTDAGKLFDIFYVLIGIGIIGFFANLLIKNGSMRRELKRNRQRAQP